MIIFINSALFKVRIVTASKTAIEEAITMLFFQVPLLTLK